METRVVLRPTEKAVDRDYDSLRYAPSVAVNSRLSGGLDIPNRSVRVKATKGCPGADSFPGLTFQDKRRASFTPDLLSS